MQQAHPQYTNNEATSARTAALQRQMVEAGLDALICLKQQNTFYISGFNPIFHSHPVVAVVPAAGKAILLVHALRGPHARSVFDGDLRLYGAWGDRVTMGMNWKAALKAILEEIGVLRGRLGIDKDFVPSGTLAELTTSLGVDGFADASALLTRARVIKDSAAIDSIRTACALTDRALAAASEVVSERGTERQISVAAINAMHSAWAQASTDYEVADFGNTEGAVHSGLGAYCLTGDRLAHMADNPTGRRVSEGELCMVFTFSVCDGMHAEQERCFAVGTVSNDARRVYDTFLRAREDIFEALRPGVSHSQLYAAGAEAYAKAGYEAYLPGRMGHALGLGAHEEPSISPHEELVLQPGMVMTVEPSLRVPFLGGGGGQHSDTVVVTDSGFELLTQHPRDFLQA